MATNSDIARVIHALIFAVHAQRHQRRKDEAKTPYINHPVALVHILAVEAGVDDADVLSAAALHDFIEGCCGPGKEWSLDEGSALLRERFGPQVLAYVDAVTDDKTLPKAERKRLQMELAAHVPHGAKLVKRADKIANLRDIATTPPVSSSTASPSSRSVILRCMD
ncbi:MAG: bifunctional (p)ppGpp synthetase/guanosine-3',5'-bis(diphosphate) 3'-pyrophosphohydrolase [Proteobacteria bacterium]|nr:bifunctional (p)ppGpp synthetase/guanosine-3',5'-bis(diphosphate) 3'-pyrophosphohydrolase [Pseudomonadota bacterium]